MSPKLPGNSRSDSSRNHGTIVALVFLLFCSAAFIGLISQILPQVLGLVLVVAGFGLFIALHYFLWGRWMMRQQHSADREEDPFNS